MQKNIVSSFVDLILFDQSLFEYENQLDILYEQLDVLQRKHANHSQEYTTKQAQLAQVKKYIKTCEQELNDAIAQEAVVNQSHKDVHDKREYTALKKELDHYHAVQQALEKKLLVALAQAEQLEKECAELQIHKNHSNETLQADIQACRSKITEIEAEFEKAKNQRVTFQEHVPLEWIAHYERVRNEIANPLSFVFEDSCSSCFQVLTPYDLLQVAKAPITCKGCYRFLCIRPE